MKPISSWHCLLLFGAMSSIFIFISGCYDYAGSPTVSEKRLIQKAYADKFDSLDCKQFLLPDGTYSKEECNILKNLIDGEDLKEEAENQAFYEVAAKVLKEGFFDSGRPIICHGLPTHCHEIYKNQTFFRKYDPNSRTVISFYDRNKNEIGHSGYGVKGTQMLLPKNDPQFVLTRIKLSDMKFQGVGYIEIKHINPASNEVLNRHIATVKFIEKRRNPKNN